MSFCLSCDKNKVIEVREDLWVIAWTSPLHPRVTGSQFVFTSLKPSYFCRFTTMSHYPKWTITSSLQNANKSHWELHLSLVVALLSCFAYKLRTAKSHARSVRLAHLVSKYHLTYHRCACNLAFASPLPLTWWVGPWRKRWALQQHRT